MRCAANHLPAASTKVGISLSIAIIFFKIRRIARLARKSRTAQAPPLPPK